MRRRPCHARWSVHLLGLMTAVALAGCVDVRTRLVADTHTERLVQVTPTGAPIVQRESHPDQGGWTIRVTQPIRADYERFQQQRWATDRYGPMPTSILIGAVQCPISSIVWALSLGRDLWGIQRACLRLIGLERYAQHHLEETDETIHTEHRTETRPQPLGLVRWEWTGDRHLVHDIPLGSDGTATIRIRQIQALLTDAHLPPETLPPGRSRLSVLVQDKELASWSIDPTDYTRIRPVERLVVAPASHWPAELRIRLTPLATSRPERQQAWTTSLTTYFLQRQIPVIASEPILAALREELQRQHLGRVADDHVVPIGHWLGATVLVSGTLEQDAGRTGLAVQLLDVEQGTQLGGFFVEGTMTSFDQQLVIIQDGLNRLLQEGLSSRQSRVQPDSPVSHE